MKQFLLFSIRKHPFLCVALGVAFTALVIFAGQFTLRAFYFNDPAHRDQSLELWMSPRYVSQSWKLPKSIIFDIMEMDSDAAPRDGPRTLSDVLTRTGMTLEQLQAKIEQAKTEQAVKRESRAQ